MGEKKIEVEREKGRGQRNEGKETRGKEKRGHMQKSKKAHIKPFSLTCCDLF